jgi:hypothetical protein
VARGDARALPHWETGLEPQDTWRHRSPFLPGGGPGATGHVATPESSRIGRRTWSHKTRRDTRALPCRVAGPVPRGTWRHQSPPTPGEGSRAAGHVATPEPFPVGWRARCHGHVVMPELFGIRSESGVVGTHGDTGALPCRVRILVPWD